MLFLLCTQVTSGSSLSSPLRSDYSRDDQAGGGWSGRAIAQWRPRVSKLGLKGLSDYHSNELAAEAAKRGASVPIKGLLSQNIYSKERAGQQL